MPKKPTRDNRKGRELRTVHTAGAGAAALLQRISGRAGVHISPLDSHPAGAPAETDRLRQLIPRELDAHVVELLVKDEGSVLFMDSAAWAARLRLWLAEHPGSGGTKPVTVRLKPRNSNKKAD
jgi:hypothetical protein